MTLSGANRRTEGDSPVTRSSPAADSPTLDSPSASFRGGDFRSMFLSGTTEEAVDTPAHDRPLSPTSLAAMQRIMSEVNRFEQGAIAAVPLLERYARGEELSSSHFRQMTDNLRVVGQGLARTEGGGELAAKVARIYESMTGERLGGDGRGPAITIPRDENVYLARSLESLGAVVDSLSASLPTDGGAPGRTTVSTPPRNVP